MGLIDDVLAPPSRAKKKAKPKTPSAKALARLREYGWEAETVEKRLPIPGLFVTKDLFGVIDIVAMKPGSPILAVQATSRTNVNARMAKAQASGKALLWVQCGGPRIRRENRGTVANRHTRKRWQLERATLRR